MLGEWKIRWDQINTNLRVFAAIMLIGSVIILTGCGHYTATVAPAKEIVLIDNNSSMVPDSKEDPNTKVYVIYGLFENGRWKVVSQDIQNYTRKELLSFYTENFTTIRPQQLMTGEVSPNGKYLLYKYTNNADGIELSKLYLLDIKTGKQQLIEKDSVGHRVEEYHWSPDGLQVVYQLYQVPPPCPTCGMSFCSSGGPWIFYTPYNGKKVYLNVENYSFSTAVGWLDTKTILFAKHCYYQETYFAYNLDNGSYNPMGMGGVVYQIGQGPKDQTTFAFIPRGYINDSVGSCGFQVMDGRSLRTVYNDSNAICNGVIGYPSKFQWLNADEIIFSKGSYVNKDIDNNVTASVYSVNVSMPFSARSVISRTSTVDYYFMGYKPIAKRLLVLELTENNTKDRFKLYLTNTQGKDIIEVARSDYEMAFYGWASLS
jgi:hypothetical protein